MLDDEIHPSNIVNGYRLAATKAKEFYTKLADPVKIDDKKTLQDIAITSMTGKSAEGATDLADLVVKAVIQVAEQVDGKTVIDKENIKLEKKSRCIN